MCTDSVMMSSYTCVHTNINKTLIVKTNKNAHTHTHASTANSGLSIHNYTANVLCHVFITIKVQIVQFYDKTLKTVAVIGACVYVGACGVQFY